MAVSPIPDGYHSATPYLIVKDASAAIAFYKRAFGATELMRLKDPSGKVVHAEVKVGDSPIMMGEECPEMGYRGPTSLGGSPVGILLYVEDADACFDQAVAAGATVHKPMKDQFYGDRSGTVTDPFGHMWTIATHIEDVSASEAQERFEASMKEHSGA